MNGIAGVPEVTQAGSGAIRPAAGEDTGRRRVPQVSRLASSPLAAELLRAEAALRRADGAREVAAELTSAAVAPVARLAGLGQSRRAGQGGGGEQQGEEDRWQVLVHGGSPFGSVGVLPPVH